MGKTGFKVRMGSLRLLLGTLLMPAPLLGATSAVSSPQEATVVGHQSRLWETLEEYCDSAGLTRVAVVLVEAESEPAYWVGGGETEGAVPDYRVGWGSLSEVLFGLALARMTEEGGVRFADRIDLLCPDLAPDNPWVGNHPLRLEHLLEHTSGLAELPPSAWTMGEVQATAPAELLDRFRETLACRHPPGRYVYPTYSELLLLAAVVEQLSGQPWARWIDETVGEPLGLSLRWFEAAESHPAAVVPASLQSILGATASLGDAARILRLLLGRGSFGGVTYLSEDTVRRLETPTTSEAVRQGLQVGYGVGLRRVAENGSLWIGQDSRLPGEYAGLRYLPAERRGAFVAFAGPETRAAELWALVEAHLTRGLEASAPLLMEIPENRLVRLEGYYLPITFRWPGLEPLHWLQGTAFLEPAPGRLQWTDASGSRSLFPVTDRRFRLEGEPLPTVVAVSGRHGEVELLALSQAFSGNFRSVSAVRVWALRGLLFWHCLLLAGWWGFRLWYWIRPRHQDGERSFAGLVTIGMLLALLGSLGFGVVVWQAPDPESWEFARKLGGLGLFSLGYGYAPWLVLFGGVAAVAGGCLPRRDSREQELRVWSVTAGAVAVLAAAVIVYLSGGA